jgi:hypothetical protein
MRRSNAASPPTPPTTPPIMAPVAVFWCEDEPPDVDEPDEPTAIVVVSVVTLVKVTPLLTAREVDLKTDVVDTIEAVELEELDVTVEEVLELDEVDVGGLDVSVGDVEAGVEVGVDVDEVDVEVDSDVAEVVEGMIMGGTVEDVEGEGLVEVTLEVAELLPEVEPDMAGEKVNRRSRNGE